MGNVYSTNTEPEIVIETFNESEVMRMIDEFDGLGKSVFNSIDSMDSIVADNVQVASGAVAGKVGEKLFKEWSENCVPLLNYSRFFDGISESMRRIYNRSTETAEAIENIYKTTDPTAIPNLTGTDSVSESAPIGDAISQEDAVSQEYADSQKEAVSQEVIDSQEVTDSQEEVVSQEVATSQEDVIPQDDVTSQENVVSQEDSTPSNENTEASTPPTAEENSTIVTSDEEPASTNKGDE